MTPLNRHSYMTSTGGLRVSASHGPHASTPGGRAWAEKSARTLRMRLRGEKTTSTLSVRTQYVVVPVHYPLVITIPASVPAAAEMAHDAPAARANTNTILDQCEPATGTDPCLQHGIPSGCDYHMPLPHMTPTSGSPGALHSSSDLVSGSGCTSLQPIIQLDINRHTHFEGKLGDVVTSSANGHAGTILDPAASEAYPTSVSSSKGGNLCLPCLPPCRLHHHLQQLCRRQIIALLTSPQPCGFNARLRICIQRPRLTKPWQKLLAMTITRMQKLG